MKKSLIYSLIIFVVLVGAAFYGFNQAADFAEEGAQEPNGPHITVDPATYDFGRVKLGDVPEFTFIVSNTGNQKLEIDGVSTSCACTKGELNIASIEPGGQADLAVSFDPGVHGDDADLGRLTRTVYISTNDPHQEEIELKIYADVYK